MSSAFFDWVVQKKNSERLICIVLFESEEKFFDQVRRLVCIVLFESKEKFFDQVRRLVCILLFESKENFWPSLKTSMYTSI